MKRVANPLGLQQASNQGTDSLPGNIQWVLKDIVCLLQYNSSPLGLIKFLSGTEDELQGYVLQNGIIVME